MSTDATSRPQDLDVVAAYPAPLSRRLCRRCLVALAVAALLPIGLALLLHPSLTYVTDVVKTPTRVPIQALLYAPSSDAESTPANMRPHVWVLRSGKPVSISVVLGAHSETEAVILQSDLHAGDRVIIAERRAR
jgi:hypothetical protein